MPGRLAPGHPSGSLKLSEVGQQQACQALVARSLTQKAIANEFTPQVLAAYNDLLSEGVLTPLGSGKVHFFHQTLLEYAIAYWLTRQSATAQRHRFFEQLQQPDTQAQRTHWLPVLRQFLAIADEAEFETWVAQLDLNAMGIFGAVAYAAVSRDRPDALRRLLPTALHLGEHHQRRPQQALMAAPRHLIEAVWDLVLALLREAEHLTAGHLAQMTGVLIACWWSSLQVHLVDTVTAIASRAPIDLDLSTGCKRYLKRP